MFLISAHQAYLKDKLLKRRLLSANIATTGIYSASGSDYAHQNQLALGSNVTDVNGQFERLMKNNSNYQFNSVTKLMQRTRKYYSSDGHKFLFNNT